MKSFANKVAAITGASSGMGRAIAVALAKRGCEVAISDVNVEGLEETARLARVHGVKVTVQKLDVADKDAVYAWADKVVKDHGKVNAIFNNAGVAYGATASGADYEDMEWVFGINFWGVVYGSKAFLPHLRASGEGHIVNTSSLFGLLAFPGQSTYNATKFAVRGFTEALRIELDMTKSCVSATSVHPGGIKTNIARAARKHASIEELGVTNDAQSHERIEKMFRMTSEDAAEIIIRGVERNERRVLVGIDAKVYDVLQRIVPSRYQWILVQAAKRMLQADAKRAPAQSVTTAAPAKSRDDDKPRATTTEQRAS